VASAFREAGADLQRLGLPSAPRRLITVHADPFRPQPRLDRDAGDGMTTSVGRIRPEPLWTHGVKYVLVSHNTKMGAAKGAILVAEYLVSKDLA
jgi:aspartate-semialdehyde dehydrogenase